MIELLLQGERALDLGLLDRAEQVYWQAIERDPRNAIAVVGLARVAIERGDETTGYRFALKALELDPENVTARRLARRMAEVIEYRGDRLPDAPAEIAPPERAGSDPERVGSSSEPAEPVDSPPEPAQPVGAPSEPSAPATEASGGESTIDPPAPASTAPASPASPAPAPPFGAAVPQPPLVLATRRRGLIGRLLRRR